MDASTRLYARLGEIPESPNDPESLDDLIVCAFGAFERYYLCWKTKGGDFRQDGYDLPPALNEWLNPLDGTSRDWASLQVVFGRGEEYFASDKNGKLEFKEPEVKKIFEEEEKERGDRQALRRSRTVSFLRPLSQTSTRSDNTLSDAIVGNKRTSSMSSYRASRPPSLSYSTTGSEASTAAPSDPQMQPEESTSLVQSSGFSRLSSIGSSASSSRAAAIMSGMKIEQPGPARQASPTDLVAPAAFTQSPETESGEIKDSSEDPGRSDNKIIPAANFQRNITARMTTSETCTCGISKINRHSYVNASVQTEPTPPLLRTSLRVDTSSASSWNHHSYRAFSQDIRTPVFDNFASAPFSMGRMTNYFSKPGYQLGDSLASGYHYYEQPMYQYQGEFGDDVLR